MLSSKQAERYHQGRSHPESFDDHIAYNQAVALAGYPLQTASRIWTGTRVEILLASAMSAFLGHSLRSLRTSGLEELIWTPVIASSSFHSSALLAKGGPKPSTRKSTGVVRKKPLKAKGNALSCNLFPGLPFYVLTIAM
jgi:hypothetical protein